MIRPISIRVVLPSLALWVTLVAATPAPVTAPTWEHWQTIPGVFDVAGPRHDGSLVVAGSGLLYLVDIAGNVSPFARGPQGYADDAGAEAYLTLSSGHEMSGAGCSFATDDVFVLRLHSPFGVIRIDGFGHATPFATVAGVEALSGITFDTSGRFAYRLLVTGPSKGKTTVAAIDCTGAVEFITRTAPALEGGLAVAPAAFGFYGGDLMVPDELSGKIYAIGPDGTVRDVVTLGLPAGPDIGVESVGFVPPGFMRGGAAYYSDRLTAGNPHPGTDSLLRLSAADLAAAGVRDGDMLAATEGGATMIGLSCHATCQVLTVVGTASSSHGEGHIAFTISKLSAPASPATSSGPASGSRGSASMVGAFVALGAVAVALAVAFALRRRRPRGS